MKTKNVITQRKNKEFLDNQRQQLENTMSNIIESNKIKILSNIKMSYFIVISIISFCFFI